MTEALETLIARVRDDRDIVSAAEETVRQGAILPVLGRLGWDRDDVRQVVPGFRVGAERVDYCLRLDGHSMALLEVTKAGTAPPAERLARLLGLAREASAGVAVLTTGLRWWLYGAAFEGPAEERLFCTVDLEAMAPADAATLLSTFLGREPLADGTALERASERLRRARARRMEGALRDAWDALRTGHDDRLVQWLANAVEAASGRRPTVKGLVAFLDEVTRPPSARPAAEPARAVEPAGAGAGRSQAGTDGEGPLTPESDGILDLEALDQLLAGLGPADDESGAGGGLADGSTVDFGSGAGRRSLAREAGGAPVLDASVAAGLGGTPSTNGHVPSSVSVEEADEEADEEAGDVAAAGWASKRPTGFSFMGEYRPVSRYDEILVGLASALYRLHRPEFGRVIMLGGGRRTLFATNRNDLRSPGHVTGADVFVERDLTPDEVVGCCEDMLTLFGYDRDQLEIELEH